MRKVNGFLTEAGTFFLAAVDGDQPKVSPLGFHLEDATAIDIAMMGVGEKLCLRKHCR